jgi:hypothetical protein
MAPALSGSARVSPVLPHGLVSTHYRHGPDVRQVKRLRQTFDSVTEFPVFRRLLVGATRGCRGNAKQLGLAALWCLRLNDRSDFCRVRLRQMIVVDE